MNEALSRKVENTTKESQAKEFQRYSRRLVRDLEAKGIVRTAVECTNLSIHANNSDVLMAECIRTFPTVTFPASMLLKREEIECGRTPGVSVITPLHHGSGQRRPAYQEAPFDLLYGFRGCTHNVDLLSPYEMLLHWSLERIEIPTKKKWRNFARDVDPRWNCLQRSLLPRKNTAKIHTRHPLCSQRSG